MTNPRAMPVPVPMATVVGATDDRREVSQKMPAMTLVTANLRNYLA
jgi:hypothetical protein